MQLLVTLPDDPYAALYGYTSESIRTQALEHNALPVISALVYQPLMKLYVALPHQRFRRIG